MDLSYSPEDEAFRAEVRSWLEENLAGEFAELRGKGGPGREHEAYDERVAWDRHLAQHGWTCIGWPEQYGGRGLPLFQQVIFHEEYARANAPARVNHLGEELLGPTLIAFGSEEQKQRFLPKIVAVEELWCQGYSEPGAGSDLANVSTKARLEGDELGHRRPEGVDLAGPPRRLVLRGRPHRARLQATPGPLLPARPDGPGGRRDPPDRSSPPAPRSSTRCSSPAPAPTRRRSSGSEGDGWKVAMGTLGFERGVSTLGQQVGFQRELDALLEVARGNGAYDDPVRPRPARARPRSSSR